MIITIVVWTTLLLITLLIQASFTMVEMAGVSLNRIHIAYLSKKGETWAKRLNLLLARPYRFFGTVMVGANLALQFHSLCARTFYERIGLQPDLAPLIQVFIVVLFAELLPSILGRRYQERIARLGIPIMFLCYRLFSPIIFVCTVLSRIKYIFKTKEWKRDIPSLSIEELPILLSDEKKQNPFQLLISNLFQTHEKEVRHSALSLSHLFKVDSQQRAQTVAMNLPQGIEYILMLEDGKPKGILNVSTILNAPADAAIGELERECWTIQGSSTVRRALSMFLSHQEQVALITNQKNQMIGYLTLDVLLSELTGMVV